MPVRHDDAMPPKEWSRFAIDADGDPAERPRRVRELLQALDIDPPAEMMLIGIDEWTTFFSLRWFFTTRVVNDDVDHRLQSGLAWDLSDDLGNAYLGGDYGGGGCNSAHWTITSQFAPAVHSGARSCRSALVRPLPDK